MEIVSCFVLCETQLLTGSMGGVFGLNYAVVLEVAKAMNIPINAKFIRLLKTFETVLVEELNKEFNKNKEYK